MGHIVAGKTNLIEMKCVIQMIEMFTKIEDIYKGKEGWDLTYMKLLWEKFGDKHLMNCFGGGNQNVEMSWKSLRNKMLLAKAFEATINGTIV